MYVKYRTYDGWGCRHLDHRPDDLPTRGDQSHINPWESTMLVPTWDAFLAASEDVTWCVIRMGNFAREIHADALISMGHTRTEAEQIAGDLDNDLPMNGPYYYGACSTQRRLSLGMLDYM